MARDTSARRLAVLEMPYAIRMNGTTGYSDHGNAYAKERTDSWSVSLWVRAEADPGTRYLVSKRKNGAPFTGWSLELTANVLGVVLTASGAATYLYGKISRPISQGWNHVVFTYAGTSLASGCVFYLNGVPFALTTITSNNLAATIVDATTTFRIGAPSDGGVTVFKGLESRVRMHSRVLTAAEVLDLYYDDRAVAVEGEWLMTDGSGPTLTGTRGATNGTIVAPTWTTDTPSHARTASAARTTSTERS